MSELNISSQTLTTNTVLTKVEGSFTTDNFDLIEDEFNKLLESGIQGILLDFSGVDEVTSAVVGAVINMGKAMNSRNGKLVLAAPGPKVMGTLEMLGVKEAMNLAESLDAGRKIIASVK